MIQTIHEAAAAIKKGPVTPIDLVEQCLAAIDRWEPKVHAVGLCRSRVCASRGPASDRRDEERPVPRAAARHPYRRQGHLRRLRLANGVWLEALGQCHCPRRCAGRARLRAAGCIFLGKTVTTQYASFDPPVTRIPGTSSARRRLQQRLGRRPGHRHVPWARSARRPAAPSPGRRPIAASLVSSPASASSAWTASCRSRTRWITRGQWGGASGTSICSLSTWHVMEKMIAAWACWKK